ncbi:holin family protein [Paenibacillus sp. OAS669]|uniref:phage holin family protein n=1 Tax=Paenibacillus sp. OAS669 TaxID=2663821 RepID=UPI00178C04D6|nr:phage holin family protein [Paenibacillus sp. OAS669]MBE1444180.1 toxin secretion/phage lysis holin [Paenibacillus sp. OAS669]
MHIKEMVSLLTEAALGGNVREFSLGGIIASIGVIVSDYLGGWDNAMKILVLLMVIDYFSGMLGAFKNKCLNSEVMFWGGVRKGIVFFVIALAAACDQLIGGQAPVFRTLALYFYAGREGLSVIENLGVLGVPMPAALTQFLEQLRQRGESNR